MEKIKKGDKQISLAAMSFAFFKIGLTAYGMAILQQIKTLIIGQRWLTRKEVDEGLAMVQLYPGPIMFNLATYAAYKKRGFSGALVSTVSFILPSFFLMLILSSLYFEYGSLPWIHPLFIALEAMVIGIVANVFIDFAVRYANNYRNIFLAVFSFFLMLLKTEALLIIIIASGLSIILNGKYLKTNVENESPSGTIPGNLRNRIIGISLTSLAILVLLIVGYLSGDGDLTLSMFKIGAVAFGNGNTIMPLLQQEAVTKHHWLTMQQFADGIGFGQITPGPFLITSTFIGFKYDGIYGSVLATLGIFAPSFLYTLIMAEVYDKFKNNKTVRAVLVGILATFTGMLLFVLIEIGKICLATPYAYLWSLFAFVLIRYKKFNMLTIFAIGIAVMLVLIALKVV